VGKRKCFLLVCLKWDELTLKLLKLANKIKVDNSVTELAKQLHHSSNVVDHINKVLSSLPHRKQIVIHPIITVLKL